MKIEGTTMKLGEMPFYWRIKKSQKEIHDFLPSRMSYSFEFLPDLDLIQHKPTKLLLQNLEKMYLENSNIGFLQDGHNLAKGYGEDFYKFIRKNLNLFSVKNILEIGCGACFLLEKLSTDGFKVEGIDPSPIAIRAGKKKNIHVISEFFPSKSISFKPDLIFHVDVLEHVSNPVDSLIKQKEFLSENGIIIINVPDCSETIKAGDISIAQHQHLNNFDINSLANVIEAAGLNVFNIEKAGFGGSLYGVASKKPVNNSKFIKPSIKNGKNFFVRAKKSYQNFENVILPLLNEKKSVGFYVPLRVLPYLSITNTYDGFRLFDDIDHWHNGYIDGLDIPIENFDDLLKKPVENLFIMSFTFGDKLKEKVLNQISNINVRTIKEVIL